MMRVSRPPGQHHCLPEARAARKASLNSGKVLSGAAVARRAATCFNSANKK
jgi:hypothetical protein